MEVTIRIPEFPPQIDARLRQRRNNFLSCSPVVSSKNCRYCIQIPALAAANVPDHLRAGRFVHMANFGYFDQEFRVTVRQGKVGAVGSVWQLRCYG